MIHLQPSFLQGQGRVQESFPEDTFYLPVLNRLPEDFVEAMVCEGGCLGGPSKHTATAQAIQARKVLFEKADNRTVLENLKNYPMDQFSMIRGKLK